MESLTGQGPSGGEASDTAAPSTRPRVMATVARLWQRYRPMSMERVGVLEEAVSALRRGVLDADLRARAGHEAHKLAGSVGTFGFMEGTRLARDLERAFRGDEPLTALDAERLGEIVAALRGELDRDEPATAPEPPPAPAPAPAESVASGDSAPLMLIVDDDQVLAERLLEEAVAWSLRARWAKDLAAARACIEQDLPDVVLLDLTFRDGTAASMAFLEELHRWQPSLPVLVFTGSGDFGDRVTVARLGARGFVQKPVPPTQVMDTVMQVLQRSRTGDARVMVVDDDPAVLETVSDLLGDHQINVISVEDPRRFWETLEDASPDLLVLDVEMPHLTGLELCRVVRTDPRWNQLPVLCLTAHHDSRTRHRMFEAGADDYVTKPFVAPELVTRVVNRLERTRLQRAMAETDTLTGVANRRRAGQVLSRYLRLADRHRQPVSVAVLDLDHFKQVNDSYGHAAGDAVLRRIGQLLGSFRGEDVVARWGGEEFLVGMYGTTRAHAVHRLAELLEQLRGEEFAATDGTTFHVSFSAGVAEYPGDGADLQALYRAADEALYQAKAAGRDRVQPVSRPALAGADGPSTDVAVVSRDQSFAQPLLRALQTRGYQVTWLPDDAAALDALAGTQPTMNARVYLVDAEQFPDALAVLAARLTSMRAHPGSRVVALTNDSADVIGHLLSSAAIQRLRKPVDHRAALQYVRQLLEPPATPPRLPATAAQPARS